MILSTILVIFIICTLVVFHEFGHFIVARASGIEVKEFMVGFGPKMGSFYKWGTEFSIRCIPLGGACVFTDEYEEEEDENGNVISRLGTAEGSFYSANVWKRIATVVAGPLFNFIIAFFLAIIVVGTTYIDKPVVMDVMDGFPAKEAGIEAGDSIIAINGERIYVSREMELMLSLYPGETMDFVLERDGQRFNVNITPQKDPETGRLLYGFAGYTDYFKGNPLQVIQYGFYELRFNVKNVVKSLLFLFNGKAKADQMVGVVGMVSVVDQMNDATIKYGLFTMIINLVSFAAMLSVNLGLLNLFPVPALDGGRLIFMLVEVLRGKPVPPEKEGFVHAIGFGLFIILSVFIFYNDIMRIIRG